MRRGNAVIAVREAQRDLQNGLAYTLRVTVNGQRVRWMGIGSPELLSRLCQNAPFYLSPEDVQILKVAHAVIVYRRARGANTHVCYELSLKQQDKEGK